MTDDSTFDTTKKQFTAAAPNVHHLVDALEKALTNPSADLRETKFDKAYLIALQIYEQFRTTQLTNRPDIQMETSNDAHTRYGKALDRTIMDTEARPDKAEETGNIIREKIGRMLTNAVELELSLGKDHIDLAVQARKLEEMLTDFHIVMLTRESQALFAPPEEDQKKPAPAIAPRTGAPQKTQAVKPLADMTLKPFNHAAHNESLLEKLDRLTTAIDAVIASPSAEIRETAANSAMTTAMDIYKKFYAMTRNDPLTQLAAPSTLETEFGMGLCLRGAEATALFRRRASGHRSRYSGTDG
jgi:hypothetical protein